jgi:hypothetical protein
MVNRKKNCFNNLERTLCIKYTRMSQQLHKYSELKITKIIRFFSDIAPIKMQHPEKSRLFVLFIFLYIFII